VQHAGSGHTELGVVDSSTTLDREGALTAQALLSAANIQASIVEGQTKVDEMLWRKLLVNAVINPITAIAGVQNGAIVDVPQYAPLITGLVAEISRTATAKGISLPTDPEEMVYSVAADTAANTSSMLADIRRGKETEIASIVGHIMEEAKAHSVPTPMLQAVKALVEAAAAVTSSATLTRSPQSKTLTGAHQKEKRQLPTIIRTVEEMQRVRKSVTGTVGCVPTMGGLHSGHLELVREAKRQTDVVVATVFVNPKQFAPTDDFDVYPRQLQDDVRMLQTAGCDYVFAPSSSEMYPEGFVTSVEVAGADNLAEGSSRPGFFKGVATVCSKLFHATLPDVAFFGQKDAQQCITIKRLVSDLAFPLEVYICPTVREEDGLAMSSRNARLTDEQRGEASIVFKALQAAKILAESRLSGSATSSASRSGSSATTATATTATTVAATSSCGGRVTTDSVHARDVIDAVYQVFATSTAIDRIDYVTLANPANGAELDRDDSVSAGAVLSTAVYLKGGDPNAPVRLIDNVVISPCSSPA